MIPLGQPVDLTFLTYSDAARRTLADATAVTLDVLDPASVTTTYTLADIEHPATGTYMITLTPAAAGHYAYHWASTGTVATALDGSFDVVAEYGKTIVAAADFSLYLNDSAAADDPRAAFILGLAQTLCETVVKPLPDGANLVILDVAQRAYANPANVRGTLGLYAEGQGPYSDVSPGRAAGGLYLTQANRQALQRLDPTRSGGAFTIDMLPATLPTLPPWDSGNDIAILDLP